MLPPGTLNLDVRVVTKRMRDSLELHLIVAEAAETMASWKTVAALPEKRHWQYHVLSHSIEWQDRCWHWGPVVEAGQAATFQPALPYCGFSNSSHHLPYHSYAHFLSLLVFPFILRSTHYSSKKNVLFAYIREDRLGIRNMNIKVWTIHILISSPVSSSLYILYKWTARLS